MMNEILMKTLDASIDRLKQATRQGKPERGALSASHMDKSI